MPKTCIADSIVLLTELLQALEDAYWEASTLQHKDRFFDVINAVYQEQTELAKLSIQDHDLEYEPISDSFRLSQGRLSALRETLDESVFRTSTAIRLEALIESTTSLFSH